MLVNGFALDNALFTSPIAVEAALTALVFLEWPRILEPCGLVGEVNAVGLTCPSAVLLRPEVGAIERFGRGAVIGCAAAARRDSCDSCPSGFVLCDEKPSEAEVGGVLSPDCRPTVEYSRPSPAVDDIVSVPCDCWEGSWVSGAL